MDITDSQKSTVIQWIQQGLSLAELQRKLNEEFQISMTYMDVRFLVDDLDVAVVEPEEDSGDDAAAEAKPAPAEEAELVDDGGTGAVSVDVDAIMRPGALVSGSVSFSDGKSLGWQLGASGQLGLIPDDDDPEYRPSPDDIQEFQTQLQDVLQKKGF
jgi:hypothetical protein